MYKILIADNEGVSIDAIRYNIKKKYDDACDIRASQNIRRIYEVFKNYEPDIMILNVNMTGVHGIATLRDLHAQCKKTLFILLSHNRYLHYGREGVYLRVEHYLLKPIRRQNLLDAMAATIRKIDHERDLVLRETENKEKLQSIVPVIEGGLLTSLLLRRLDPAELPEYTQLLSFYPSHVWFMTIDISDGMIGNKIINPIGAMIRLREKDALFRTIIKAFFPNTIVGPILANRCICMVPGTGQTPDLARVEKMQGQLIRKLDLEFAIHISDVMPFTKEGLKNFRF